MYKERKPEWWKDCGLTEKPWCDYAQMLDQFDCAVNDGFAPDELVFMSTEEDQKAFETARNKFFAEILDKPERIAAVRRLCLDLAAWNNTGMSDFWGYVGKMDDFHLVKVCYHMLACMWD